MARKIELEIPDEMTIEEFFKQLNSAFSLPKTSAPLNHITYEIEKAITFVYFKCPYCGEKYDWYDKPLPKEARCRNCAKIFDLPKVTFGDHNE